MATTQVLPVGFRRWALRLSSIEGILVGPFATFLEIWFVSFLQIHLGVHSPLLLGTISLLPVLATIVIGPWAGQIITRMGGSMRATWLTCFFQAVLLLGYVVPILWPKMSGAIYIVIVLHLSMSVIGAISFSSWVGSIGEVLPSSVRGTFIGNRMRLFMVCKIISALIFAGLLQVLPMGYSSTGILSVILVIVGTRILSTAILIRFAQSHEGLALQREEKTTASGSLVPAHTFVQNLQAFPKSGMMRWTITYGMILFAASIGGIMCVPFANFTSPKGLGLENQALLFAVLFQISQLVRLFSYPIVGRMIDRYGPERMMTIASVGVALIAINWAFATSWWMLIPGEILSGFSWCIIECAVISLFFGCHADATKRAGLVAMSNMMLSSVQCAGGFLGSWLAECLMPIWESSIRSVFVVSFVLRLAAAAIGLKLLSHHRMRTAGKKV